MQWDRGLEDTFYELLGYSTPYLTLDFTVENDVDGLTPGSSYQFRYRASNKYGWGEFSDSVTFQAAAQPL